MLTSCFLSLFNAITHQQALLINWKPDPVIFSATNASYTSKNYISGRREHTKLHTYLYMPTSKLLTCSDSYCQLRGISCSFLSLHASQLSLPSLSIGYNFGVGEKCYCVSRGISLLSFERRQMKTMHPARCLFNFEYAKLCNKSLILCRFVCACMKLMSEF